MNIQQESFNETFVLSKNRRSFLWTILGAYFVLRILMMVQVPFTDTTALCRDGSQDGGDQ
jgi:hypothetical protein